MVKFSQIINLILKREIQQPNETPTIHISSKKVIIENDNEL